MPPAWTVRPVREDERERLVAFLTRSWGSSTIVSRGRARDASKLPALACLEGEDLIGLATYEPLADHVELVTLDAIRRGEGIGGALLDAVANQARKAGARDVRLITSNDNLDALRFYQRRGFRMTRIHWGAIDDARKIKPSIPSVGGYGIPIHDEIELTLEVINPGEGDPPNESPPALQHLS